MAESPVSKYAVRSHGKEEAPSNSNGGRERRSTPERRLPFVKTDLEEIAAYARFPGAHVAFHMEVRRVAGQTRIKARGGWLSLDRISWERVHLTDRSARCRAVNRTRSLGWLEIRGKAGSKLEYRVPPDWARPRAKVIDLALSREGRG